MYPWHQHVLLNGLDLWRMPSGVVVIIFRFHLAFPYRLRNISIILIGSAPVLRGNTKMYHEVASIISRYEVNPSCDCCTICFGCVPLLSTPCMLDGPLMYPTSMWYAVTGMKVSL